MWVCVCVLNVNACHRVYLFFTYSLINTYNYEMNWKWFCPFRTFRLWKLCAFLRIHLWAKPNIHIRIFSWAFFHCSLLFSCSSCMLCCQQFARNQQNCMLSSVVFIILELEFSWLLHKLIVHVQPATETTTMSQESTKNNENTESTQRHNKKAKYKQ